MSTHESKSYRYAYPHPAVTADIAVFTVRQGKLSILLIERGEEPFKGAWALPGGFLREDEDVDQCARRELKEETGVEARLRPSFGVFSAPGRDPRERVVTVAYLALARDDQLTPRAGSDAANVAWRDVTDLPKLAFDHADIIAAALKALRAQLETTDILLGLMPKLFSMTQLQSAHEIVMGEAVDKRNFRKRVLESGWVEATGETERGAHRPARLYRASAASNFR